MPRKNINVGFVFLFLITILVLSPRLCHAQSITIPNITGISFSKSADDRALAITNSFTMHGMQVQPVNLTLAYDAVGDIFSMYGEITLSFDGNTLSTTFGSQADPGFRIINDQLDQVLFTFNGEFDLQTLDISPQDLTFRYDTANDRYVMFGDVLVKLGEDEIDALFGDEGDPGVVIQNGELEHINIGVTADFYLKNLQITPTDLTFEWDRAQDRYIIYGDVAVTMEGDSFDALLGTADDPGIEIVNGAVDHINLGVTADFKLKDLEINPQNLTIEWDSTDENQQATGTSPYFDGVDDCVVFSNEPHFRLQEFTISYWASVQLEDRTHTLVSKGSLNYHTAFSEDMVPRIYVADSTGAHESWSHTKPALNEWHHYAFVYSQAQGIYKVYMDGSESGSRNPDSFGPLVDIHEPLTLGILRYQDNWHPFTGQMKELRIWNSARSESEIAQYMDTGLSGDEDGLIGYWPMDEGDGHVIQDHSVYHNDGAMYGPVWKSDDVEITHPDNRYIFYGELDLNIDGQIIDASFGDRDNPGLLVENGRIQHIFIDINSDVKFGNVEMETKNLTLEYKDDIYHLTGIVLAKDMWKAEIDLGQGDNAGIELDVSGDSDEFILEDVILLIEHAELGSIDFKRIRLEFANNTIEDADLYVSFPPGWEVEGDMTFVGNPAKVHEVSIDWEAENIEEAIELPGTGAVLMYLSGDINNIDNPSELTFTGDVGITYGGPFDVDGKELALVHMDDQVAISKSYLKVGGDIGIGCYQSGSTWHSELGYGDANFHFYWNDYYKIYGTFKIPTDPMIEANVDVLISESGNFDALMDVEFIVPHFVPYIHGKHFGSVDGAIRYLHGHSTHSYAAGWTKINLWLTHLYVGAKYNLGTKHISKIGSHDIEDIKNDIHGDGGLAKANVMNGGGYTTLTQTFTLNSPAPTFTRVQLHWPVIIEIAYLTVTGPEGQLNLIPVTVQDDGDSTSMPTVTAGENLTSVSNDTTVEFLLAANSSIRTESDAEKAPMSIGQYLVSFSYQGQSSFDSLTIIADQLYPEPTGSITATKQDDGSVELAFNYWCYIPDSCLVSLFWNDTTSHNGRLIAHLPYGDIGVDGSGANIINFVPADLHAGEELLFYLVVEDHINTPFYSDFTPVVTYDPPVYGNVAVTNADSLQSGITLFIDASGDGNFDIYTAGLSETSCVTNSNGDFSFHRLAPDSYTFDMVVPNGYELSDASPQLLPVTVTYSGQPIQLNFVLEKSGQ